MIFFPLFLYVLKSCQNELKREIDSRPERQQESARNGQFSGILTIFFFFLQPLPPTSYSDLISVHSTGSTPPRPLLDVKYHALMLDIPIRSSLSVFSVLCCQIASCVFRINSLRLPHTKLISAQFHRLRPDSIEFFFFFFFFFLLNGSPSLFLQEQIQGQGKRPGEETTAD